LGLKIREMTGQVPGIGEGRAARKAATGYLEKAGGHEGAVGGDSVVLSPAALEACRARAVEASTPGGPGGPLPDPDETSRAILAKELEILFRNIYV
jgi:hypothetical protein